MYEAKVKEIRRLHRVCKQYRREKNELCEILTALLENSQDEKAKTKAARLIELWGGKQ